MEVQAITKNLSMSPQKVREVVRQIQGLPAEAALPHHLVKQSHSLVSVVQGLLPQIANAENNRNLKVENLRVKEAVAGAATTLKRFTPKARGSAGPILKRRSHIRIVLSDE